MGRCWGGRRWIVYLALVDAWVATVARCSTDREARGGQTQVVYADIPEKVLKLALKQRNENVIMLVRHRVRDEMLSGYSAGMTHFVEVPSTSERYVGVDWKHSWNRFASSSNLFGTAILAG